MTREMLDRYMSERSVQEMVYSKVFRGLGTEGTKLIEMMVESVLAYFDSECTRHYLTLHEKIGYTDEKLRKAVLEAVPSKIRSNKSEYTKLTVIRNPETLVEYENAFKLAAIRAEGFIASVVGYVVLNPPQEEDDCFDAREAKDGDVVTYFSSGLGEVSTGVVRGDNPYSDGVDVYGDGWKQYAGKWFILKVVRAGAVIYQKKDAEEMGL